MKRLTIVFALALFAGGVSLRGELKPTPAAPPSQPASAAVTTTHDQASAQAVPRAPSSLSDGDARNPIVEHLRASMILDYATYLVAAITAIFAIFLGALGIFEWRRVETLKKEVIEERRELRDERKTIQSLIQAAKSELLVQEQRFRAEIAEERKASEARIDRIEVLKPELESLESRLRANQRFLDAALAHHSNLLVGIVKGFAELRPEEEKTLKSLIAEAESALDLARPKKETVMSALLRLEQIGSHGSVNALTELRDDVTQDPSIRIRAQTVLLKVKQRIMNEPST